MSERPLILEAREPRTRFGRVVRWAFWLFQLLMVVVTFGTCAAVIPYAGSQDLEVAAGAGLFAAKTLGIAWTAWPVGTLVLGVLLLATRGRRRLVAVPPSSVARPPGDAPPPAPASAPMQGRPRGSVPESGPGPPPP